MNQNERVFSLVKEFLRGVDSGDFDNIGKIPGKYTYEYLLALYMCADMLDNGKRLYEQLYDITIAHGKNRV